MAQSEHESLSALEHLMDEFFNPNTSNARKHEIETQLGAFSNQRDSWKICIHFLNHTSSQYVSMYALSTIESVINRQWFSLDWEQRKQLKTALHTYLVKNNAGCPNFLRNKIAKVLVDIARHDWPEFYPTFITIVLEFLQSDQEQLLGLVLLRITSEEIMSNHVEMASRQKEILQQLLEGHVPEIFRHLTSFLERLSSTRRRGHTVTATPPPSPTHPGTEGITPSPPPLVAATFRPDTKDMTREILSTLQHIFSWVNLTHVTPQLLGAIFQFTNIQNTDDETCVLALSTINELLYRKCAPPEIQNLFVELYHYAVQLLRDIIDRNIIDQNNIDSIGPDFIDKMSEFLCLLVSQYLWRLEATDSGFSALDFLSLLFQCTFQQTNIDSFLSCLDVWQAFMKQLKRENTFKYTEALLTLVKQILNKMQFLHNQNQLEELDNEMIDDDNQTEWQSFLKECIEMIALVAETMPDVVFNQVWVPWRAANDLFYLIEKAVNEQNRTFQLDPNEITRLHCVLRDLATLTQTLARLSVYFTDDQQQRDAIDLLANELLKSALYATRIRFDRLQINDQRLRNDFIDVHAEILAGLKTWCLNTNALHKPHNTNNTSCGSTNDNNTATQQINDLVTVCTPILLNGNQEPAKLSLSAAHLFLCVTNITFPPNLITLPAVVELLRSAPHLTYQDEHSLNILHQAMCNLLVRPWGDLNENDRNQRHLLIKVFFDALTKNFRDLTPTTNENDAKQIINATLPRIAQIIQYCSNHSTASKKLLYMGIQTTIQYALTLYSSFAVRSPEINSTILELFHVVLHVLQQQLGLDFTKMAVQMFLDIAINSQQLTGLDKLLEILQLVVEGPGQMYKTFLPGIISLCMEHVYPSIASQANLYPDVMSALLKLLHSIMLHRWQYFYTSQVRLGYSPGTSDISQQHQQQQQQQTSTAAAENEALHNQEQLLAILQAFGQALLQPDLNVFRLSLASLEHLNNKWKLYHKFLFKERLLSQFLTVLLQTLLHKSHALLTDDITLAIYNMSAVDFNGFFDLFLVHFLNTTGELDHQQKQSLKAHFTADTDMPTFARNLNQFINDMRCYQISNTSLPSGSVVL